MTEPHVTLSILVPVRNEGINIEVMVKILSALLEIPYEILIVHDELNDNTIPVVERLQRKGGHVRLVHNNIGRGVANAIRAGVQAAKGEYVLIFAADEVGPVLAISDMLTLMSEGCDFVSCTRYAYGGRRLGGSFVGGALSRIANVLFRFCTKSVFTDATTGIKMFRKKVFEGMELNARPVGWSVAFEMAIKAQLAGLRLGEVPIISIDRLYGGESTFSVGPWAVEYFRWFLWGVRRMHVFSTIQRPKLMVKG